MLQHLPSVGNRTMQGAIVLQLIGFYMPVLWARDGQGSVTVGPLQQQL